ncbi:hypothetical protein DB31_7807 [Hyalangium minutum]|uniref:Uncharacterized protein n=1 Tax=Hyalangium minutum TaxID=394096 RepID=A0A085WLK7_9BACT|nr:hypothetical protein DB31_7807 [Hyalangium minutum]
MALVACSSSRSEATKPSPQEGTEQSTPQVPPPPVVPPPEPVPAPPPIPRTPPASPRCGPDEMDCCGACIPRSEKRCPENIHCPTAAPEK